MMKDSLETKIKGHGKRRRRALGTINQLLQHIVSEGLNIDVALPEVLRIAMDVLKAFGGSILVVDEQFRLQHSWLISGWQDEAQAEFLSVAIQEGFAGWVMRNQQPANIPDTRHDTRWLPGPGYSSTSEPWSTICVPLIIRNRSVGAITMTRSGIDQFGDADLDLLVAMAEQAAITIESARLYEVSQQRANELAALVEFTSALSATLDPDQLFHETGKYMATLIRADASAIFEWLPESEHFECRSAQVSEDNVYDEQYLLRQVYPGSHQFVSRLIQERTPAQFQLNQLPDDDELYKYMRGAGIRSLLVVPMLVRDAVLGIAGLAMLRSQEEFESAQVQLAQSLANQAAIALQNARQFERAQAAEARYLSLFEDSINPLVLTDLEGRIVEANRRAWQELGCELNNLTGHPIGALHQLAGEDAAMDITLPIAEDDAIVRFQSALRRHDKKPLPVEVQVRRTSFHGEPLLLWSYQDLSQRVALDELRDDLTAMLVHDLQSPLANIISSVDILRQELLTDTPTATTLLDIAATSSRNLQNLIHSILDINRLEAGYPLTELSYFDLPDVITEAVQSISASLSQHRAELLFCYDKDLPPAYGEQNMIRRVLVNLLENSVKYSPAGAPVSITVRRLPESTQLLVSVSDQGPGVQPEHRQLIFHKFQRPRANGTPAVKGLGLGLAFCRLAVEAHGGAIWVDDAPGGGARFNFTLATSPF